MNDPQVSVVVPVFNSSTSLVELVERVEQVFSAKLHESWELIFVDDGSPNPETWPTIQTIVAKYAEVVALQFTRNFGQHVATIAGLSVARGQWVVTLDDDLQHCPEDIPLLLADRNHDAVIGQFAQRKHGFSSRITSRIKGWFDAILIGKPKGVQLTSFRVLSRVVVDAMLQISTSYPFIGAMLLFVTSDLKPVRVTHQPRKTGKTGYNFWRRFRTFTNLLINNSSILLKLVGWIGIGISFLAFLAGAGLILRQIFWGSLIEGWTSLIVTLLVIGGLLLFSIGIIGEYLIRIVNNTERKPMYVIRREEKSWKK